MEILDEATISKIKNCKRSGFPICLEKALSRMFRDSELEKLTERILGNPELREEMLSSAEQLWEIYDRMLEEFTRELGGDVSAVIEFQSFKEMQSMGCSMCPLYQREAEKRKVG